MCADRIEITQPRNPPFLVSVRQIGKDVFNHQLAGTVGIGRRAREILPNRYRGRVAVDRGRGTENQRLHRHFRHYFAQGNCPADVAIIIAQRLRYRFANRFKPGKMDDGIDLRRGEDLPQKRSVPDIAKKEHRPLPSDPCNTIEHLGAAVRQVVDDRDSVARRQQCNTGVRADIACTPGNHDVHFPASLTALCIPNRHGRWATKFPANAWPAYRNALGKQQRLFCRP